MTESAQSPLSATTPCAWMGCKHPFDKHHPWGCTVLVTDYATKRYDHEGNRLPPIDRPCGCTWVEPVDAKPRPVKDNPQS